MTLAQLVISTNLEVIFFLSDKRRKCLLTGIPQECGNMSEFTLGAGLTKYKHRQEIIIIKDSIWALQIQSMLQDKLSAFHESLHMTYWMESEWLPFIL